MKKINNKNIQEISVVKNFLVISPANRMFISIFIVSLSNFIPISISSDYTDILTYHLFQQNLY